METCKNNIDEVYSYIEENAIKFEYSHQIASLFQELRDKLEGEGKSSEVKKAQWEIDFFNFHFKNGEPKPMYSFADDAGEISIYPDLDKFNNNEYDYLEARLKEVRNPIVVARYAHILWCSPKKHNKFGRMAVDSYLELVKQYEKRDKELPKNHFGLCVLDSMKNAWFIARKVNHEKEFICSEFKRLIKRYDFKSSSSFVLRINLIKLMLNQRKCFSKKDFTGFAIICWKISKILVTEDNINAAVVALECGERLDKNTGDVSYNWRKKIAELYEALMDQKSKEPMVALECCQEAINSYKKLKNGSKAVKLRTQYTNKIKKIEKQYFKYKESLTFKKFEQTVDLSEYRKACAKFADDLTQSRPERIIECLMLHNILPKYEDVKKSAKEEMEKNPIFQMFATVHYDLSGNLVQHFSSDDETEYLNILTIYNIELQMERFMFVNEILLAAIRKKKLSANILLEFFSKHSWFGEKLTKKLPNEKTLEYNWLSLIAPAINEYFYQMNLSMINPLNRPNFVLCIDSLVLKFEGLFRDICRYLGGSTTKTSKDKKGRNITLETDINNLLHEPVLLKKITEDDLLFFKFLFIEKAGYNLRHKIAHTLMPFQGYSMEYMQFLLVALIRLGKYDFVRNDNV